jgi:hypothetical protein
MASQPEQAANGSLLPRRRSKEQHPKTHNDSAGQLNHSPDRQQDAFVWLGKLGWRRGLLLPGALLMAMSSELLSPFMFVNFGFPTFL